MQSEEVQAWEACDPRYDRQALAVAALLLVGDVVPALFSPLSGTVGDRLTGGG